MERGQEAMREGELHGWEARGKVWQSCPCPLVSSGCGNQWCFSQLESLKPHHHMQRVIALSQLQPGKFTSICVYGRSHALEFGVGRRV